MFGSNPDLPDSDGDGFSDLEENKTGLDPNVSMQIIVLTTIRKSLIQIQQGKSELLDGSFKNGQL